MTTTDIIGQLDVASATQLGRPASSILDWKMVFRHSNSEEMRILG